MTDDIDQKKASIAASKRKYLAKPGVREARNTLNREWIARNRDRYNQAKSEYRFRIKVEVIKLYSDGSMACAHCGFSADIDALCLDHINDDGAAHRKEFGISCRGGVGTTIYERIRALGKLDGLQVLCANCNMIKELRRKRGRTSDEMHTAIQNFRGWKKPPPGHSENF